MPTTTDPLRAFADAPVTDAGPADLGFRWYRNGTVVPSLSGDEVPASETRKGDTWRVEVVATDDNGESEPVEASVTVLNTPPVATVTVEPGQPTSIEDVLALPMGEDADGDAVSFLITWSADGAPDVVGATLTADATARDQRWTVTVVPTDGEEDGPAVTAAVIVRNGPPSLSAAAIAPEPLTVATDATATASGTDPDGDDVRFRYAWTVDGVEMGGQPSLIRALFRRGQQVGLTVTPTDGNLDGEPLTVEPVTVANALPTLIGVDLQPEQVFEATTLSCDALGPLDADGDPVTLAWSWTVNGAPIAPVTPTLDGTWFDRGDDVACTVTPSDGFEDGAAITSLTRRVDNTPPAVTSAGIPVLSPGPGQDLVLEYTTEDDDGDDVQVSFAWVVNGSPVPGNAPTLPSVYVVRDNTVQVTLVPNDGLVDGAPFTTPVLVIGNAPPEIRSVVLEPQAPTVEEDIVAVTDAFDRNLDPVTLEHTWFVNGTRINGLVDDMLPGSRYRRGDAVTVRVTPRDLEDVGDPVTSDPVTVANAPPRATNALISPGVVQESTTVVCLGNGWFDADGDSAGYAVSWTIDGVNAGTASTLTGADFNKGQVLRCVATPDDGIDLGEPLTSEPVTVANTPPRLTDAFLDNLTPAVGNTLLVTATGLTDVDPQDAAFLTTEYQWLVNGVELPGETGPTLSDGFVRGDVVECIVTPYDRTDRGTPVLSDAAVVRNSAPTMVSVTLTPTDPRVTSTVNALAVADDPDGDALTLRYQWSVDGTIVKDGPQDFLEPAFFGRDDVIRAVVRATDGLVTSATLTSDPVTVRNTPPTAPTVRSTPRWARPATDSLVCAVVAPSTDPEGDPIAYRFTWTRNGTPHTAGGGYLGPQRGTFDGDTIPAADIGDGETWVCSATAYDPREDGGTGSTTSRSATFDLNSLTASGDYTCGIDQSGRTRCWGWNALGQATPSQVPLARVRAGQQAACGVSTSNALSCWGALASPPGGANWSDVGVGFAHGCARSTSGGLTCWGNNLFGESTPPNGTWSQLAVGTLHNCALNRTGTPTCWGYDNRGQATAPAGPFVALTTGGEFSCGLRPNSTIACWGLPAVASAVPSGTFVDVRAGAVHACAIDANDQIRCWGDASVVDLVPPPGAYAQVAPGAVHTCAVTVQGEVVCWGESEAGQLQVPLTAYPEVAPGYAHTCALDDDGMIHCWGLDDEGQASPPGFLGEALAITSGDKHSCAIMADRSIQCWGDLSRNQLFSPTTGSYLAIDAGRNHTCALSTTGAISCWGESTGGRLNAPTTGVWTDVSAGEHHSCAVSDVGNVTCWGADSAGETIAPTVNFVDVDAGELHTCGVRTNGALQCWGSNTFGQTTPPGGANWQDVVSGAEHSCARGASGNVTCWGSSLYGLATAPSDTFDVIGMGRYHACGTTSAGRTRCWGLYAY